MTHSFPTRRSSDLSVQFRHRQRVRAAALRRQQSQSGSGHDHRQSREGEAEERVADGVAGPSLVAVDHDLRLLLPGHQGRRLPATPPPDRKSVVYGKSVSVSVVPGGSGTINKKNTKEK